MKTTGMAEEAADSIEAVAQAHPSLFLNLMARWTRWLHGVYQRQEEEARLATRQTFER